MINATKNQAIVNQAVKFVHNDGGRAAAGYKGTTGDCATRALAIASGKSYQEVYDLINNLALQERPRRAKRIITATGIKALPAGPRSNAREGVFRGTFDKAVKALGGTWRPTMRIGTGCKVHLRQSELPATGRHILSVSKHYAAWINGTLQDIYDCSRGGDRCVYGIYTFPEIS